LVSLATSCPSDVAKCGSERDKERCVTVIVKSYRCYEYPF
jgi:hypothetical protein